MGQYWYSIVMFEQFHFEPFGPETDNFGKVIVL
jgi:hypothetical protein